jgi:hypothetical protein
MFKKLLAIGMVALFAFSVPVVPAFASDLTIGQAPAQFQALSSLTDARRDQLAAMSDDELAAVEGAGVCLACFTLATIKQTNVSVYSFKTFQSNWSLVYQSNN